MPRYAENTKVSSEKSRAEIERTLKRYGADSFFYGTQSGRAVVAFEAFARRVRFDMKLPHLDEFAETETGRARSAGSMESAYEQAVKQRWRALSLVIKAKLEAVESGITSFEDEFLSHIVLPGGQTVGEWMKPQVERAYITGKLPPLLPAPGGE